MPSNQFGEAGFKIDSQKYDKFKREFAEAKERILLEWGQIAENNAIDIITAAKAVQTGRLRASITHATKATENRTYSYQDDNGQEYTDRIGEGIPDNQAVVGTNVEYAA